MFRSLYIDACLSIRLLTDKHTERLDYAGQLDMETIMHNMTKVSAKGIVQVDDRSEDLPHWVLSAMKCLANWPKQLKTVNGRESCLPNYDGFEQDVFNVVKDYFLGLPGPLTTCSLYEFFLEAFRRAEGSNSAILPGPCPSKGTTGRMNCQIHPGSMTRPCTRPYTETQLDVPPQDNQFYAMIGDTQDLSSLSNQERVARIRQTFQVLPPLATSSLQNSNTSNTTLLSSGHSTLDSISYSLSPDMTTTAIMKQFLPPNTCFETAFVEESPITRIVPQKEHETLHIKRSWSGRSLSHIPTDWSTKTTATQTDGDQAHDQQSSSLKRLPRWKRAGRFRKSIAVMESSAAGKRRSSSTSTSSCDSGGIVNGGFSDTPPVCSNPAGESFASSRQLYTSADVPSQASLSSIRGYSSVDSLLDRENKFEEQFMMKYRQVSGDLRSSCDQLVEARHVARDRSFIESKALRKEKKKRRLRNSSTDRLGYDTDNEVNYHDPSALGESLKNCYINHGLETSPRQNLVEATAPLASQEVCDLSPVPFNRHTKYNASYRLATNQPSTPAQRFSFPRTSTQIDLQPKNNNNTHHSKPSSSIPKRSFLAPPPSECLYVRAEPYNCLNSDVSSSLVSERRDTATKNTTVPRLTNPMFKDPLPQSRKLSVGRSEGQQPSLAAGSFVRSSTHRASRMSQATVDSGRYSDYSRGSGRTVSAKVPLPLSSSVSDGGPRLSHTLPHAGATVSRQIQQNSEEAQVAVLKLLCLLVPPSNRRKLQLLLKFIRKVS